MKTLKIMVMGFFFLSFLSIPHMNDAELVQKAGTGEVNWEIGKISAVGIGAPNPNAVNAGQRRAMTIQAAKADALNNLAELTQGVRVSSTALVKNFVTQNNQVKLEVDAVIKGATMVGSPKYLADGSVEVTMELPIFGPKSVSSVIYKAQQPEFQKNTASQRPTVAAPPPPTDLKKKQEELEAARKAREEADRAAQAAADKAKAEAEAKRKADEEMTRLQAEMEQKRKAEEARLAQEQALQKTKAEELRRLEAEKVSREQERLAAEKKQREAEEAARQAKAAEEKLKAEEAARKAAEEAKRKELEQKAAAEAARKAQEAEATRKSDELARKAALEAEQKKKDEELKKLADVKNKAEEERRKAEEASKKAAELAAQRAREEEIKRKAEEEARKNTPSTGVTDAAVGDMSAYTGLIIDTTGTGVRPAMSPKVLILPPPPPEKEVYSMAEANYQIALNVGLVGYARTVDSAKQRKPRVGENPLVIKAVGVKDGKPSDVQISYADGMKLQKLDSQNKVLENCKVVMVLGESGGKAFLIRSGNGFSLVFDPTF